MSNYFKALGAKLWVPLSTMALLATQTHAQGNYDCNGVQVWTSTVAYAGEINVVYNEKAYQSKWWTQGNQPNISVDLTPGKTDGSKYWILLGTCNNGTVAPNTWVINNSDPAKLIMQTDPAISIVNLNTTLLDEPTLNTGWYKFNIKGRTNIIGDDNALEIWSGTKANPQIGGRRQYITFNNALYPSGIPFASIGSNSFLLSASPQTQVTDLILQPNAGSKLGIGTFTTSPLATLHINGDVLANSDINVGSKLASNTFQIYGPKLSFSQSTVAGGWNDDNSDAVWLSRYHVASNQTELRLNIGDDPSLLGDAFVIGSSNSASNGAWTPTFTVNTNGDIIAEGRLKVKGKIATTEVCVTPTASWCDYVFEKDYKLMPLNELRTFVNKNKHLPEIPTTAEVKESGVNLGEINVLYLKKIEELTLYVLELQKQIDELKKR